MERSATASACFNNLLCIWDEMLPSRESTTSWHMIQTSRISKNVRCLWKSDKKLKSNPNWSPMPESILSPLFWKLRNLEGTVLALRADALWNPLLHSLAFNGSMEFTALSVKVSQRSIMPKSAEMLLPRKTTSSGRVHGDYRISSLSRIEVVGLFWVFLFFVFFCHVINYPKYINLTQ